MDVTPSCAHEIAGATQVVSGDRGCKMSGSIADGEAV
jgi:hypothetical protein